MKKSRHIVLFLLTLMALVSCVETYEPEVITDANSFLVVEGFLNSGNDSSEIKLSRTIVLADTAGYYPEGGATVEIESENGAPDFQLEEGWSGRYFLEPVELNPEDRYRLKILTQDGKEHLSDYVEVKVTPPIDSINWIYEPEKGVTIYANTHDPENKSWYYRWEYEEDWEYKPPYNIIEIDNVLETITCYAHNKSTHIIIGSSAKLNEDVINKQPIAFIPGVSRKLSFKYSILVKQYVLSKEEFEYYRQLKKNSEEMGSLFDPQPMELQGNIRSTKLPDEPVAGFFSTGSLQEERIWINYYDLTNPAWGFRWLCGDPVPWYCANCATKDSQVKPPFWD